jgi:hypothetical protein
MDTKTQSETRQIRRRTRRHDTRCKNGKTTATHEATPNEGTRKRSVGLGIIVRDEDSPQAADRAESGNSGNVEKHTEACEERNHTTPEGRYKGVFLGRLWNGAALGSLCTPSRSASYMLKRATWIAPRRLQTSLWEHKARYGSYER